MIWKVENKVTHKIDTWYSNDLIEILKECCKQRELLSSQMIMQIIRDYEQ
jgi:hypothetical protein